MVKPSHSPRVLIKCNVLFLGYGPQTANATELDALTDPLCDAYPAHAGSELRGINSWLTIYTSGIQLQLVDGRNPPVFWFPIQNLYIAAANKCINYVDPTTGAVLNSKFVELGNQEAKQSSHAPLFSFIFRKAQGYESDCYTFMTKNDDSAFGLVEAARYAYNNTAGHSTEGIPDKIAAEEIVPGSSDSDSSAGDSDAPLIINVDDVRRDSGHNDKTDIFPERLVRSQRLELQRPPQQSMDRRSELNYLAPIRAQPTIHRTEDRIPSRRTTTRSSRQYPPAPIQENVKVIRPPPLYIKAPPPKVMVVKQPPQIVQTPPQIIRQIVDRPVTVEKEVIREVKVEVPVAVPGPPQPPVYIQSEPEIKWVDRPYPVEVPVEVPVPYHVRSPTPPARIVTVPEYIEREVPVPYEVRSPTPPPQFIEVPVQVPVYIEVEGPPQFIRSPPEIQEIPVPYAVEVPYQVPVEVPHFYPIPLKGGRSKQGRRRKHEEYYDDRYLNRRDTHDQGYFVSPEFRDRRGHISNYADRDEAWRGRPRRPHRRRSRSSSYSGDSSSPESRGGRRRDRRDYGLSNGLSGIRITEVDDRGRPVSDFSPQPRRHMRDEGRRHSRSRERYEAEGYDFYRPAPERRGHESRLPKSDRRQRRYAYDDYYIQERRVSPKRYDRDQPFSPASARDYYDGHMPAHMSDTISELPPHPRSSRSRY